MGFDISFAKAPDAFAIPNAKWQTEFLLAFTDFQVVPVDIEALAAELAEDLGLSVEEFVRRGIGLQVEPVAPSAAVLYISFYESTAVVTLSNFPDEGPVSAIAGIGRIRSFFAERGFSLPEVGAPRGEDSEDSYLYRGYVQRQKLVGAVAKLVATPGGDVPPGSPADAILRP